jgi:hypothetical protein
LTFRRCEPIVGASTLAMWRLSMKTAPLSEKAMVSMGTGKVVCK